MTMALGFELPNVPVPVAATWQQVEALRSTCLKVRPYHLSTSTLEHIRARNLAVILRPNSDEGVTFDVRGRTQELRESIEKLQLYATTTYCVVDNEPNHVNNNAQPTADYWARVRAVFESLALDFPGVKFISPPMAVAQNEPAWYASGADVIRLHDYMGVHLYGQTDNNLVTYALDLADAFDMPMIADELGNTSQHLSPDNKAFAVASYARQAAESGVVMATIFIAKHPTPEWDYCTLPTDKLGMIADAVATVTPYEPPQPTTAPEPPKESPMRIWTREEIIALIIAYSDAAGAPRRLPLACGVAESNLRQFAERYGYHTDEGMIAIETPQADDDWVVINKMIADGTPVDCSFSIGQQIVVGAPVGDKTMTPENIKRVRQWLFDPENSVPLMVGKLAQSYDDRIQAGYSDIDAQWAALYKYNTGDWLPPGGRFAGNVGNYARGFDAADAILATWEDELTTAEKNIIRDALNELWALKSAFEANNDPTNAHYIEKRVVRIKDAAGIT